MRKRLLGLLLVVCLFVGMMPAMSVGAVTTTCTTYSGSNVEAQDYSRYTNPIDSYLTTCSDDTIMRVQSGSGIDGVLVEYYDTSYNLQSSKIVAEELPLFGGFYETDTNYFLLTGQMNTDESADVEVYRITKYDKSWNRIASCGLYGANTTVPFDAGSARMDTYGKYLLIRTCHEMYMSDDGKNHQANVTIQVDMETMTISDSYTGVMNYGYGYVSHSFNQFIKIEDGKIVSLDHGDAHPRSLALLKYYTDVSTGKFFPSNSKNCTLINVLTFSGDSGENVTGASVGGFEISDSSYLVAGNSVIQDADNLTRTTRNVFVAAVDKSTSSVTMNWITSYDEGDGTTSTPQFVKISDDRYILLWSRDNTVYYTEIDGTGKQTGEIYTLVGNLSDCVPVIVGNKLVWYTWAYETVTFYDISLADLTQTTTTVIENGHKYENLGVTDGYASLKCSVCGGEKELMVATKITTYWNEDGGSSYSTKVPSSERLIGTSVYFWVGSFYPSGADSQIEVIVSDPSVIAYEPADGGIGNRGTLTMLKKGTATVTIRPKYNPDAAQVYTFSTDDHYHEFEWIKTEGSTATLGCTLCDDIKEVAVATTFGLWWNEDGGTSYSSYLATTRDIGEVFYYWARITESGVDGNIEVIVSNPEILSYEPSTSNQSLGAFTPLKTGRTSITFRLKYNPSVSQLVNIKVNGELEAASFTADKQSPQVIGSDVILSAEAVGGTWNYTYKFYEADASGNTNVIRDYASSATCTWSPQTVGTRTLYVDIKDSDGAVVTKSIEYTVSPFSITRATLMLQNDIGVIFKTPADYGNVYHDFYVEVVQEKENGETETQKIDGVLSADGEFYEFLYTGVNAKETGDNLDATIYAYDAQGSLVTGETLEDYSVKQYCMTQLAKSDEDLAASGMSTEQQAAFRILLVDLLNYSAEAQEYFAYKTDALVNTDLTETQAAYASDDSMIADLQNVTNVKQAEIAEPLATWKSAALNLLSKTTLRVKFSYEGDISEVTMTAAVENGSSVEISEFTAINDSTYYAFFDGMKSYEFGSPVDFTLKANGESISNTLRYSVESYASKMKDNASVGDVVSAMMKYGKAAQSYKGLTNNQY